GIAVRGELLLHNHPSGVLEPSGADLSVAARLHDGGVGFAIVDNDVTDCYVVVECPRPRATTRIDPIDVAALLSPSGPVARGSSRRGTRETRCSRTSAGPSWTASRRGPPGRATARSPTSRTSRAARYGTRWRPSRICARGSSVPISTAASCSRRGGARRRRT